MRTIALMPRRRAWIAFGCIAAVTAVAGAGAFLGWGSRASGPIEANALVDKRVDGLSLYQLASTWTTDDEKQIRLTDLRGRSQILALIFTTCSGTCPLTVKELQQLESAMPNRIAKRTRFVLVTIDPADSTAALREYRRTMKLDDHWTLLRSAPDAIRELAATLGFNYEKQGDQFAHTNLVTVLDPRGNIVHQQPGAGGNRQDLIAAVERSLTM
jgi:protein SCO1